MSPATRRPPARALAGGRALLLAGTLALSAAVAPPAAAQGGPAAVDDPVADYVRRWPPLDEPWNELLRIRRDFNNDGVEDMAVVSVRPGVARLKGCSRAGDRTHGFTVVVDATGVTGARDPRRPSWPLEGGSGPLYEEFCRDYVPPPYDESCPLADWRAGRCRWTTSR